MDDPPAWEWIDAGRYRFQFSRIASLQNTGLQLPVVSPDGKWVAAWQCADATTLDPDAPLTGATLAKLTLVIYDTTDPQASPRTVSTGAAWPVWSADSKQLMAVAYDKSNHCALIIHQLATGQTRRIEIGVAHIITPSLSPGGTLLAFAGFDLTAQQSRLYVYNLQTQQLTPLAPPKDVVWQIMPAWVSDHALLYFARVGTDTGILGTVPQANSPNSWLAKVPLPNEASETVRTHAGIIHPLSPDKQWLATFDSSQNRVALLHLEDAKPTPLDFSSQAGCWAPTTQAARFLYATDKQLLLHKSGAEETSHLLGAKPFLPLWCDPRGTSLLLLATGQQEWSFELLRMKISRSPK